MGNEQEEVNQVAANKLNISAQALGKAILNSEAYNNFIKARDQFRIDDSAKEASREYNAVISDYQNRTRWGGITAEDKNKIEEARKKAMENEVLGNYYTTQEKLIGFYQEINTYLSEKLKFNFASLAKPASGCCG
ncbi:MAG: YlbF family regulator [Ignavibacteriales bacterium]|nr:YlbF family regulator [Ignavibacteriales bacterium]